VSAVYLLASTFGLVFALSLQSKLVNNGHYVAAFLNSAAIGACNLVLFRLAPDATGLEIVGYLAGGPFGVIASMWVYRRMRAGSMLLHDFPLIGRIFSERRL